MKLNFASKSWAETEGASFPHAIPRRDWLKLMAAMGAAGVALNSLRAAETSPALSGAGRRPAILLYSGWATHNIGDIGHTPGTLRYLTEYFPEARVTCWLRKFNPEVVAMLHRRFPGVTFLEGGELRADGVASTPELQAAFNGADLFIQNSGMHFTRYWGPPTGLLKACLAKKKPFGLYGQSFDGFRTEDATTVPGLLSQAAFIFCRDNESLHFLRGAGVTPAVLEFGPDGCFGIDVRDDTKAAAFMHANGLEPRKFVCVILRTDKEISKNPGEELERLPGGPVEWSAKVREIIIDWVKRTGLRVALVPEVEKEIGPMKTMILDQLPEEIRSHVVHRQTFWNADEAVSLYAQAHTVIGVEPHSCIMALAMGTPMIHFFTRRHGYKAWMFRDIGLPEWLIDIDTEPAARVTAALNRIHDHYDLAQGKVKRAMQFVNSRSAEMIGEVRRTL